MTFLEAFVRSDIFQQKAEQYQIWSPSKFTFSGNWNSKNQGKFVFIWLIYIGLMNISICDQCFQKISFVNFSTNCFNVVMYSKNNMASKNSRYWKSKGKPKQCSLFILFIPLYKRQTLWLVQLITWLKLFDVTENQTKTKILLVDRPVKSRTLFENIDVVYMQNVFIQNSAYILLASHKNELFFKYWDDLICLYWISKEF